MRRLVISDFHFGSPATLGRHPLILERLAGELEWAQQLIINGDLLSLFAAPLDVALTHARPFLSLVAEHVSEVVFLPGNHDHHLTYLSADERAINIALGKPEHDLLDLTAAERVLTAMMPGVHVNARNPWVRLDGVTYTHGHLMHALGRETRLPPLDRRRFARIIDGRETLTPMAAEDYEGLMAPLFELAYAAERGPSSPETLTERAAWRTRSRARMDSSRPSCPFWVPLLGAWLAPQLHMKAGLRPTPYLLCLMAQMMRDWQIPDGLICYAHTHQPHGPMPAPMESRWSFANSGAWFLDRHVLAASKGLQWHPGTVLRVDGEHIETRRLLDDLSVEDLSRLAAESANA